MQSFVFTKWMPLHTPHKGIAQTETKSFTIFMEALHIALQPYCKQTMHYSKKTKKNNMEVATENGIAIGHCGAHFSMAHWKILCPQFGQTLSVSLTMRSDTLWFSFLFFSFWFYFIFFRSFSQCQWVCCLFSFSVAISLFQSIHVLFTIANEWQQPILTASAEVPDLNSSSASMCIILRYGPLLALDSWRSERKTVYVVSHSMVIAQSAGKWFGWRCCSHRLNALQTTLFDFHQSSKVRNVFSSHSLSFVCVCRCAICCRPLRVWWIRCVCVWPERNKLIESILSAETFYSHLPAAIVSIECAERENHSHNKHGASK